jgi:putative ABC transport system permease protein
MKKFSNMIKVGFFLATAQIKRAGGLTTALTIAVMVFSFLAQVFITGILIGLIEGTSIEYRAKYTGDLIIIPLDKKTLVERTYDITRTLDQDPLVTAYTVRLDGGGKIEANSSNRASGDKADTIAARVFGVDFAKEEKTTKMSENIIEGEYITAADSSRYILIGSDLIDRYAQGPDATAFLTEIYPGTRIKLTINDKVEEFIVAGIFKTKVETASSVFMKAEAYKRLTGNTTSDASHIAVRARNIGDETQIKQNLLNNDFGSYARVRTYQEDEPAFVKDLKSLFGLMGTMFGSITLSVAAITVYIVISINTITRRKYIGILKGIGISGGAIELAYVIQSFLYGVIGVAVGAFIIFAGIKPFFDKNPIDFPFSDGILVATIPDTVTKAVVLLFIAIFAAYFAARGTIRQNTLDAILGRNPAKKQKTGKRNIFVRIITSPVTLLQRFIQNASNKKIKEESANLTQEQ